MLNSSTAHRRSHLTPVTHCSSHTHWVWDMYMYVRYDRKKLCNMPCVEAGRGGPRCSFDASVFFTFYPHLTTHRQVDKRPFLFIYLGSRLARCARTKSRDHAGKRKREESLNTQAFTVKCSFLAHLVAFVARFPHATPTGGRGWPHGGHSRAQVGARQLRGLQVHRGKLCPAEPRWCLAGAYPQRQGV